MSSQCSWKANANPPACELHNELLVLAAIPIDEHVRNLGVVNCYICPVSKAVVNESKSTTRRLD